MNAMPHAFGRRVCAAALAILMLPTAGARAQVAPPAAEPHHRA
jgi:hypothetical protein